MLRELKYHKFNIYVVYLKNVLCFTHIPLLSIVMV
jgi:hypothetical protein